MYFFPGFVRFAAFGNPPSIFGLNARADQILAMGGNPAYPPTVTKNLRSAFGPARSSGRAVQVAASGLTSAGQTSIPGPS
jgi:hypothetical protein